MKLIVQLSAEGGKAIMKLADYELSERERLAIIHELTSDNEYTILTVPGFIKENGASPQE